MGSLKRAGDILPLIFELKDCIIIESKKSGKIIISQDLLNISLKKMILSKVNQISDFRCDFHTGKITIIKKVFLLSLTLEFHDLKFLINENVYKIIAKYSHSNVLYFLNLIKVLPDFIKITNDNIEINFIKIEGFEKLKAHGFFGIDILNTTVISFENCRDGYLTFSYEFI